MVWHNVRWSFNLLIHPVVMFPCVGKLKICLARNYCRSCDIVSTCLFMSVVRVSCCWFVGGVSCIICGRCSSRNDVIISFYVRCGPCRLCYPRTKPRTRYGFVVIKGDVFIDFYWGIFWVKGVERVLVIVDIDPVLAFLLWYYMFCLVLVL